MHPESSRTVEQAFEAAPAGMALVDAGGRLLRVNDALCRLTGRTRDDLLARTLGAITCDESGALATWLAAVADGATPRYAREQPIVRADGRVTWVQMTVVALEADPDAPSALLCHLADVSEPRRAANRLRSLVEHDALTGVASRRAWEAELPRALDRARVSGTDLALALIDLNDFKSINDSHGHHAGDRFLQAAAAAWRRALRATDFLARIGGDEFGVLLAGVSDAAVDATVARLRAALRGTRGCSIGTAVWDGSESPTALTRRADVQLYADKAAQAHTRLTDPQRIAAVHASGLFEGPSRPDLDQVTQTAAWLLEAPVSFLSTVTGEQLHFTSHAGLPPAIAANPTVPIELSFCRYTVGAGRALVIPDAREDPRFATNPLVEHLGVVAYAGIPVLDAADHPLGALCAVDFRARSWTPEQVGALATLATRAMA